MSGLYEVESRLQTKGNFRIYYRCHTIDGGDNASFRSTERVEMGRAETFGHDGRGTPLIEILAYGDAGTRQEQAGIDGEIGSEHR